MYTFKELTEDVLKELPDNYDWPERTLVELVNAGLRSLGDIALVEETKFDAGDTKSEDYVTSLPWKRRRPLMIDYYADEKRWVRVYDWELIPALSNSTGLIVFKEEIPDKSRIRIWYVDTHSRVSEDSDEISDTLAHELATATGIERALRWQNSRMGGGEGILMQAWNDAKIELARARVNFPVWTPRKVAKLLKVKGQ